MEIIESYTKESVRWFVVFWAFAFVLSVIVYIARGEPYAPYHHNPTIIFPILTALVLFVTGRKYVVDRSGISVYLLGIKIQTMTWSKIREICMVHQKALGEGDYRVYIVRKNAPYVGRPWPYWLALDDTSNQDSEFYGLGWDDRSMQNGIWTAQ